MKTKGNSTDSVLPPNKTDPAVIARFAALSDEDIDSMLFAMNLSQKAQLVSGRDFWQTRSFDHPFIPSIRFCDGPSGLRRQMDTSDHLGISPSAPATCFPSASALACSWDAELCRKIGKALGLEAAALDVDVLLAPTVNIIENPLGGRNFEMWSEDPYLCGVLASALTQGIQENVSACVKHFDVNGREKFRQAADERVSARALAALYQPAFHRIVKTARPDWIMSA